LPAGGRSGNLDARANRWDADEYERLKEERERLKAEIDVSAAFAFALLCFVRRLCFALCDAVDELTCLACMPWGVPML
jgi:hypothetical protein